MKKHIFNFTAPAFSLLALYLILFSKWVIVDNSKMSPLYFTKMIVQMSGKKIGINDFHIYGLLILLAGACALGKLFIKKDSKEVKWLSIASVIFGVLGLALLVFKFVNLNEFNSKFGSYFALKIGLTYWLGFLMNILVIYFSLCSLNIGPFKEEEAYHYLAQFGKLLLVLIVKLMILIKDLIAKLVKMYKENNKEQTSEDEKSKNDFNNKDSEVSSEIQVDETVEETQQDIK